MIIYILFDNYQNIFKIKTTILIMELGKLNLNQKQVDGLKMFVQHNGYLNKDTKERLDKINGNLGAIKVLLMMKLEISQEQLDKEFAKLNKKD